jgi:hypothetical protein
LWVQAAGALPASIKIVIPLAALEVEEVVAHYHI